MSKRIEPGCLAIVLDSIWPENIGRVVTCEYKDRDGDWFVRSTEPMVVGLSPSMKTTGFICERHLLRIDDYDESAEKIEQHQEVTA